MKTQICLALGCNIRKMDKTRKWRSMEKRTNNKRREKRIRSW
jgi:hypothetical protein